MLAESFAYDKSGTQLTIKLRKGLKFQSGADMTSADVVASIDRYMNAAGIGASLKGVVEKLDRPRSRHRRLQIEVADADRARTSDDHPGRDHVEGLAPGRLADDAGQEARLHRPVRGHQFPA